MSRIFPTLASLSLMLVAAALIMGLSIGDLYVSPPDPGALAWRGRHLLMGTAAALAVVLVESIAATYFIGTSRWCKEVSEAYGLSPSMLQAINRLKRMTFLWAVLGMLTIVAVGALGAASDPGTGRATARETSTFHLVAAWGGFAIVAYSYLRIWINIRSNQAVIAEVLGHVAKIRAERGLDAYVSPTS